MALITFILGTAGIIVVYFIPSSDAVAGIATLSLMFLLFSFKWSSGVR